MTHQQAFFLVSGIVFGLVALLHALRLAFRWQVCVRSQEIPMWFSARLLPFLYSLASTNQAASMV